MMDDPVDRVFSHALSLVTKVRTGDRTPPAETRLELYGLYKQSMEGDVIRIMDRPSGKSVQVRRAQEKWDAWRTQQGLSRTAAKCEYIDTLLAALREYVEPGRSRDLVAEVEFVWSQVKPNMRPGTATSIHSASVMSDSDDLSDMGAAGFDQDDEFVDAVDSDSDDRLQQLDRSALFRDDDDLPGSLPVSTMATGAVPTAELVIRRQRSSRSSRPSSGRSRRSAPTSSSETAWRHRVEVAVEQLTAEVAALREQLQFQHALEPAPAPSISSSASSFSGALLARLLPWPILSSAGRFGWMNKLMGWAAEVVWSAIKHAAINALVVGVVLSYLRRHALPASPVSGLSPFTDGAGRLEDAIRILVGDAIAATFHHARNFSRRQPGRIASSYVSRTNRLGVPTTVTMAMARPGSSGRSVGSVTSSASASSGYASGDC